LAAATKDKMPAFDAVDGSHHRYRNFFSWLSATSLIAVIGRPFCDRIADVRISKLEGPFWVDSGLSV
jgi:hypothetical protein